MRILYVTTVGMTMCFFEDYIKLLIENKHEVQIACNNSNEDVPEFYIKNNIKQHNLSCSRNPLNIGNISVIKQIEKIVESEHFDIVHCHTPIVSACCRLACRKARKKGTKVIYTAHGFHFYKGAPLKHWLIFYPIEKICSFFTDVLITINKEDYAFAQKKFKAKRVEYVPGVGIDVKRFSENSVDILSKREELNIPKSVFLILSVGELNENKNHEAVIKAIADLNDTDIHYAIAGCGILEDHLINLAKELNVDNQIHLLGFRKDIPDLYKTADIYVHPSFREGLPVSVMEALASGMPIICTNIRGNSDIVEHNRNGYVVDVDNSFDLSQAISKIKNNTDDIGRDNTLDAKRYDISVINNEMSRIYFNQEDKT